MLLLLLLLSVLVSLSLSLMPLGEHNHMLLAPAPHLLHARTVKVGGCAKTGHELRSRVGNLPPVLRHCFEQERRPPLPRGVVHERVGTSLPR